MKKDGICKAGLPAPRVYSREPGFRTTFHHTYSFWDMGRVVSITPTRPPTIVGRALGDAAHPTRVFLQPFVTILKFVPGWRKTV